MQFAVALRPDDANLLYNVACIYFNMNKKPEALTKAWEAGFRNVDWARRDPDLGLLHGDPGFECLYPERPAGDRGARAASRGPSFRRSARVYNDAPG